MNPSLRFSPLLCLLLTVGFGCAHPAPEPPPVQPTSTALPIDEKHINLTDGVDQATCTVDASYPLISETAALPVQMRQAINQHITDAVATLLGNNAGGGPDATANGFVAECKAELEARVGYAYSWDETLADQVTENEHGILSILLTWEGYTGGAHPNMRSEGLVFDTETTQQLELLDVIDPEARVDVATRIATSLKESSDQGQMLSEQFSGELDAFLADPSDEKAIHLLSDYGTFTVSPDELTIHYDPYEIAAYVAGPFEVALSRNDLGDALLLSSGD